MDDRDLIKCAEDMDKEQKFKQIIDAQQNDYKNKVIAHQESQRVTECDKCAEHYLDCLCSYPICTICGAVVYRHDKLCTKCLIKESRDQIIKTDRLLKEIKSI